MLTTKHYSQDRIKREQLIKEIGEGEIIATFTIDRHHKNGLELHSITTNGIIVIKNKRTKKLITKLIARPKQIKKYFKKVTPKVEEILKIAELHKELGYNLV